MDVPQGENDLDVSFFASDHAADDPVYYYLFSPADLEPAVTESGNIDVTAIDTTPTPDNPTGNASLIAPDPQPGLWEIDVMQGATTDGTVFAQTVTGVLAYNQLAPVTETGLPTSTSTSIDSGSSVPVTVTVKNTTNHVGYFGLQPSATDISGGNTVTPLELAAGATGTLTATLSPTDLRGNRREQHPQRHRLDGLGRLLSPPSGSRRRRPTSTTSPTPTRSGASSTV